MIDITVVIPISLLVVKSLKLRIETMQRALKEFYKDVEVIVVEQSLDGSFYFLPELNGCRKIEIKYPVFNKGWCINVGVKQAKTKYVMVCDCDMYARGYEWENVVDWMNYRKHQWAFGWNRLIYTNYNQRFEVLNGGLCLGLQKTMPTRGYSEGGMVCFRRDFFYQIGQFNEFIQELGGIDSEVIKRCHFTTKTYPMFPMLIYHLHHAQQKKSSRPTRFENIKKIRHLNRNTKPVIEWLRKQNQGCSDTPLVAKKGYLE